MEWRVLQDVVLAMIATLGFAILFNAPKRVLLMCAVAGGAGFLTRTIMVQAGMSANLATLLAGFVIGLIGEFGARRHHVPAFVVGVTGFIPLVPGVLSYQTVLAILDGNYAEGLTNGLRTALLAGAIAAGIGIATALFRLRSFRTH